MTPLGRLAALLAWFCALPVAAQTAGTTVDPSAQAYFDRALAIVRNRALHRDAADWKGLGLETAPKLAGARTPAETYPTIRYLLQRLGDPQAALATPDEAAQLRARESHVLPDDPEALGKVMPARVGMIILPPFVPSDGTAAARFSDLLRGRLREIDPGACGWMIDLRETSGGDRWPMLAGLGPLLGSGVVAFATDDEGRATPWAYQNGMLSEGDTVVGSVFPPYELDQPDAPIAVLTGSGTRGAGEAVLVALRGRPHVRSFGETTGGPAVGTTSFELSDGALLTLTTGLYMDRAGRTYGGAIAPDVTIPGAGNPKNTQPIVAGTSWLNAQPECRRR